LLLVVASLVIAAVLTTVTAVAFASYSPGNSKASAIVTEQGLDYQSQSTASR
jgi:hypothetical protein